MENKKEKVVVVGMPVQGTFQKWKDRAPTLNICLDLFSMELVEARDDGDEENYREYYAAKPYGRVNGILFDSSKSAYYQCSVDSFENEDVGAIILMLRSAPEDNTFTKTVYNALPYIVANLYGIFPDIIISMPIP